MKAMMLHCAEYLADWCSHEMNLQARKEGAERRGERES
jgi:hypothetical protein